MKIKATYRDDGPEYTFDWRGSELAVGDLVVDGSQWLKVTALTSDYSRNVRTLNTIARRASDPLPPAPAKVHHEHQVTERRIVVPSTRGGWMDAEIVLGCGCSPHEVDIHELARDVRQQYGWNMAVGSWSSYDNKLRVRMRA